ncbi:MAG: alpha/beta hydrolase [Cyanobacteria bacterium J06648_16]
MRFGPTLFPSIPQLLQATAISVLSGLIAMVPAHAADEIYFDFDPFSRSLTTKSLGEFVEDGVVDADLARYLRFIPPEKHQDFRRILGTPLSSVSSDIPDNLLDPFVISQWLYSPMGETVLTALGQLIQTEGRQNGQQAIRAALILAAADPEGLSIMNIIRSYPTGGIRLNLREILALSRARDANLDTTQQLIAFARQESTTATATDPILDYSVLPVLAKNGRFGVRQQALLLQDDQRNRAYPVDIYLPDNPNAVSGPIPVMIFSHGYGDTRTKPEFVAAARTLAENGFFVALPEHVGSNRSYQRDFVRGLHSESFDAMEFINRPLDIHFLLDTLEQLNSDEFQGQLQLDRVGLLGHSFGGYSALAASGATVDIERLQRQCQFETDISPEKNNIGLALQCRLLELMDLPEVIQQLTNGSLRDERVGLVIALAPVSNLFGEGGMAQIQHPVVLVGGAADMAAPVALEQLVAFRGLTTPQKYLYLGENASHSSALTELVLGVTDADNELLATISQASEVFTSLVLSLTIAHGRVHLLDDESYLPYLTASYVEAVNSVTPISFRLLRSVPENF